MKGNGLWGAMTRLGGKECNPDNIRKLGAKIKARPDESEDDLRIRRSKAL